MQIYYSQHFVKKLKKLDRNSIKAFKQKMVLMAQDISHPSLRVKKIQGTEHIYEASINMGIRMTWQYYENGILLRNIGEHDKTLKQP